MRREVLRMQRIKFSQNAIDIVDNGNLHVFKSEVVGVVGRNRAGKSTMLGAVTGEYPCHQGDIWINEQKKQIASIEDARKKGIFLIKDGSSLISEFTIKNTMKLNFAFVKKRERYHTYIKKCRETLCTLDVCEDTDTRIRNLNFHKRVLIEIAQALVCDAEVLVFDNVISMLSQPACSQMENIFQLLKGRGISIILVESQPESILRYLDRLYIMRKGRVVGELGRDEMEDGLIFSMMDGEPFQPKDGNLKMLEEVDASREVLSFCHVKSLNGVLRDLSFTLYSKETLGIWNRNRHSGQEVLDVLAGKSGLASGTILVRGIEFNELGNGMLEKEKVFLIPEEDMFCTNMNLEENISLAALRANSYGKVVRKEGELRYLVHNLSSEYLSDEGYRIFPSQDIPDNVLISKKASLCRAIAGGAEVIVYNNPYLKMDYREREIFSRDILKTQKRKISQVIISAQLDSLYPVCNRVLRLYEGRITEVIKK